MTESVATGGAHDVRWWFWVVAVGILLYVVLDILAQLLPPHYSPVTQAESDLAVGPYGFLMTLNFVNRGLFSLVFLYALVQTVRPEREGWRPLRSGVAFLAIWAVGAVLLAAFPTDVPNLPLSWHGAIHLVVALLAFFGGAVGTFALADHFGDTEALRPMKGWAFPLTFVVVLLFVLELGAGFLVPHLATEVGGLTERLFLGSVLLWMLLVSISLARRPDPTTETSIASRPAVER